MNPLNFSQFTVWTQLNIKTHLKLVKTLQVLKSLFTFFEWLHWRCTCYWPGGRRTRPWPGGARWCWGPRSGIALATLKSVACPHQAGNKLPTTLQKKTRKVSMEMIEMYYYDQLKSDHNNLTKFLEWIWS